MWLLTGVGGVGLQNFHPSVADFEEWPFSEAPRLKLPTRYWKMLSPRCPMLNPKSRRFMRWASKALFQSVRLNSFCTLCRIPSRPCMLTFDFAHCWVTCQHSPRSHRLRQELCFPVVLRVPAPKIHPPFGKTPLKAELVRGRR